MLGGSLTRFWPDDYQDGRGLFMTMLKGGLQGLKRTRNPLKLPSNTISRFKVGLARGVKWKAEEVLKQEITKQAKKVLSNSNMEKDVSVAIAVYTDWP